MELHYLSILLQVSVFIDKFEIGAAYRTDKALSGLMMFDLADWG